MPKRLIALALVALAVFCLNAAMGKAHDNCIDLQLSGWTIIGCILHDGTVGWTTIGDDGTLYRWVDDEWVAQAPPALPTNHDAPCNPQVDEESVPITCMGTSSRAPSVYYEAGVDGEGATHRTHVRVLGSSGDVWLQVSCVDGEIAVEFWHNSHFVQLSGYGHSVVEVGLSVDGVYINPAALPSLTSLPLEEVTRALEEASRDNFNINYGSSLRAAQGAWVYSRIRGGAQLGLRIRGRNDPTVLNFNLEALFGTPVQANLDQCGSY